MLVRWNTAICSRAFRQLTYRFTQPRVNVSYDTTTVRNEENPFRDIIGDREIVGFTAGRPSYFDAHCHPFPSIRYRECSPEIMALREKERGDWRKLNIDEKKCLYRASFRQTFAEFDFPLYRWRLIFGILFMLIGLALSFHCLIRYIAYFPEELPATLTPEGRIANYERLVGINNNPITGNYRPPGAKRKYFAKNEEQLKKLSKIQAMEED